MDVRITRFDIAREGEMLWRTYLDQRYAEFFRAWPVNLSREEVVNLERKYGTQLHTVWYKEDPVGFFNLSCVNEVSGTCYAGWLLFEDCRDIKVGDYPLGAMVGFKSAELCFDKANLQKISCRFLKDREDIIRSAERLGMVKEGDLHNSTYHDGQLRDELEYAWFKPAYKVLKQKVDSDARTVK